MAKPLPKLPFFRPASGTFRSAAAVELTCPQADGCEMFDLLKLAGTLRTWQIRYCGGDFRACARLRLSEAGRTAPPNLMPNGQFLRFSDPIKSGK